MKFDDLWQHIDTNDGSDDQYEPPTRYGDGDSEDAAMSFNGIDLSSEHLHEALTDAIARSGFDPANDVLSDGYLSNIQGIAAEYLVADALNHCGDGLQYQLYSDTNHPDADIAAFAPDGTLVRMLQVKATSSPWYAETGHHPGVEVVATSDGFRSGMEMMDVSAASLRSEIRVLLSAS
jgi:hypothetical protein